MVDNDPRNALDPSQLKMNPADLHREEVFTDLKMGSIRRLTPINPDGTLDPGRPIRFTGETQILTGAGPLPVNAPIEAKTLAEAVARFPEAVKQAVDQMISTAEEYRRQEASRLVIPGREQVSRLKL